MKRNKTRAEYQRRIKLACDYIEQHLEQTIRLEDVALASCFSAYHFHRIFHAMTGETVNDYISRKRLEKAAKMLIFNSQMSVTEVALAGGFSSGANFSKAFKLYFGVTPSDLRNYEAVDDGNSEKSKIGKLFSKYGKAFNPLDLYSQFVTRRDIFEPDKLENLLMQIKVEERPEMPIACLASERGYVLDSVYATWEKLEQWASNRGLDTSFSNKFAICYDNPVITPEDKCRYEAAIVIGTDTPVAEPFVRSVLPGGKYAVAHYRDTADKISSFMTELCSRWLCDSGYEPDNFPSIFNYLNDSKNEDVVEMDVYIKLKVLKTA
ncbi:MAG: AraC family transcriptional regulator [Gammaproteobacteria bacterium]|nr:AraC family transcriptional regulator [Gammaproteobacteria bacterium]